jgi:hypothetical protein
MSSIASLMIEISKTTRKGVIAETGSIGEISLIESNIDEKRKKMLK